MKLLGWFSARKVGSLNQEDARFHLKNFPKQNDVALIIRNEPADHVSLELYCRSLDGVFSTKEHRSGALRISSKSPTSSPIEVPIGPRIRDDFYMRVYELGDLEGGDEHALRWKHGLASTKKVFELFKLRKPRAKCDSGSDAGSGRAVTEEAEVLTSSNSILEGALGAASAGFSIKGTALPKSTPPLERPSEERPPSDSETQSTDSPAPPEARTSEQPPAAPRAQHAIEPAGSKIEGEAAPDIPPVCPHGSKLDSLPAPSSNPQRSGRRLPWLRLCAVFALTTIATWGVMYVGNGYRGGTLSDLPRVGSSTPSLGLRLSRAGERVKISWDRNAPPIRNAHDAVLEINDGKDYREISVTAGELAHGSILYLPKSSEVAFRLQVYGPGTRKSESIRLMGSQKLSGHMVGEPGKPSEAMKSRAATATLKSEGKIIEIGRKLAADPNRPMPGKTEAGPPAQMGVPALKLPAQVSNDSHDTVLNLGTKASDAARATQARNTASGSESAHHNASSGEPSSRVDSAVQITTRQSPYPDQARTGPISPSGRQSVGAYIPPRPVQQVLPKFAGRAERLGLVTAEVRVGVRVSESGRVAEARLLQTENTVPPAFYRAALDAAKGWVFTPASMNGKTIASNHVIVFQFRH